jgi:hypothetical protein
MHGPLRIIRPIGSTDASYQDAFIYKGDFIDIAGLRIDVLEYTSKETIIQLSKP